MFCDDKVGTRITDMRAARNVSQAQLAEAVGIAATQLYRYESGRVAPRPTTLSKLAKALGVTTEWLARGEGRSPTSTARADLDFGPGALAGSDYEAITLKAPAGFARRIEALASSNGRSFNEEAITRLEWSLSLVDAPTTKEFKTPLTQPVGGDLTWNITAEIKQYAEEHDIPFDEAFAKIVLAGLYPTAPEVLYLPIFPGATTQELRAAMEASKKLVRPDATIVSEMLQRAPWAPTWMAERIARHDAQADFVTRDEDGSVTLLQAKEVKAPMHDLVDPAALETGRVRIRRSVAGQTPPKPATKKSTKS